MEREREQRKEVKDSQNLSKDDMRRSMKDALTHLRKKFFKEGDPTKRPEPTKRTILYIPTRKPPTLEQIRKRNRREESIRDRRKIKTGIFTLNNNKNYMTI